MFTDRIADFLASVPLFQRLSTPELRGFAEFTREQRYMRGAVIFRQGDPGDALYVVRNGAVKVVLIGDDGREVILGTLGVGDHFGELSLIDDQPRSAHVLATQATTLLVLRREDFRRQVERQPRVAWALMSELSRRLREADAKIGGLVMLDVPARVARLLLDRATQSGNAIIERPPTHETMAHMIGASRETVSRAMRELQDGGFITVERRVITIADPAGLKARSRGLPPRDKSAEKPAPSTAAGGNAEA